MSEEHMRNLAAQLRQPGGTDGLAVADMMHASNIGMTRHAIETLDLQSGDIILELGHGNGAHLTEVFQKVDKLLYQGLDISPLMHEEAMRLNSNWVAENKAAFYLYEGRQMPFEDESVDKIFTVNTIYFWEDPKLTLSELYRILRVGGKLAITFGQKSFMENLPFTRFGFTLYDRESIEQLVDGSGFSIVSVENRQETISGKAGEPVERVFSTALLERASQP